MAGQIINRKNNTWIVRMYLGKDAKGRRKYFNKTVHGTKKDAQKFLTAKLREKDLGVFIEPVSVYLNDLLDRWLNDIVQIKVSERTLNNYESLLNNHIRPKLGLKLVSEIKDFEVQKIYSDMVKSNYAPKTVKHVHNAISSALKQAIIWKIIFQNPCDQCELPKQEKSEMKYLSAEETAIFLKRAKDDKYFPAFYLAIETGMRPEEYLGLQWKDFDFINKVVAVRRALITKKGGGFIFAEPKTKQSRRSIPISNSLISALKVYRRKQLEQRMKLGANYKNLDIVFASEIGTPTLHRNFERRHFKPIRNESNVTKIRLYDLRHTMATLLLSANENPKVVSERLGHASVVLTLDTYSHVLPSIQKTATDKIEKLMQFG